MDHHVYTRPFLLYNKCARFSRIITKYARIRDWSSAKFNYGWYCQFCYALLEETVNYIGRLYWKSDSLELFYDIWKINVNTNQKLFSFMKGIWKKTMIIGALFSPAASVLVSVGSPWLFFGGGREKWWEI